MPSPQQIPEFGRLKTIRFLHRYRRFIPAFGDEVRENLGGVIIYHMDERYYYVTDPELADHIFKLDHKLVKKPTIYDDLRSFQGNGPVVNSGQDWLTQRRMTAPNFMRSQLEGAVPRMSAEVVKMMEQWRKKAAGGSTFNIVPDLNQLTFRVLCAAVLGQSLDRYLDDVYREINRGIHLFQKRTFSPLKTPLWVPMPVNIRYRNSATLYRSAVQKILDNAEAEESTPGMLANLIRTKGRKDKDVLDIISTMIAAGFETTANALAWTLFHLGKNPQVQDKLRQEIGQALQGQEFSTSHIDRIPYLNWVMRESLRINPPIWLPGRLILSEIDFNGFKIPTGSTVYINIWTINRHPDYWDRPTEFIPERFSPERLTERHEKAFISFAKGPRECQGMQFALMEMQIILAHLFQNFSLELGQGYQAEPEVALVVRPRGGVDVRLRTLS